MNNMSPVAALDIADAHNITAMLAAKCLQSVAEIDCSGYISQDFGMRLTNFTCKKIEVPCYLSISADTGAVNWRDDEDDEFNYNYSIEFSNFNFILSRNESIVAIVEPTNAVYAVTKTIYNQLKKWCKEKNKSENNNAFLTSYSMTHLMRVLGFEVEKKFDTDKCTCYIFKLNPHHANMRFSVYDKCKGNAHAIAEAIKKEFSEYKNFAFNVEYHRYAPELIKIHASNLEFS